MIRVTIDLVDTKDNRRNRCVGIGYITSELSFNTKSLIYDKIYTYRFTNRIPNINRIWLRGAVGPILSESHIYWERLYLVLKSIFGKQHD